jgi:hypothetical protein
MPWLALAFGQGSQLPQCRTSPHAEIAARAAFATLTLNARKEANFLQRLNRGQCANQKTSDACAKPHRHLI